MMLSEHFSLAEFEHSQWAARHNCANKLPEEYYDRTRKLCEQLLEPVREHFDSPVIISSGYRSDMVNSGVGGAVSSQHMQGEAADIQVLGHTPFEVATWIAEESERVFDQVILEYDGWTHLSYTERYQNRGDILTINKDGRFIGLYV